MCISEIESLVSMKNVEGKGVDVLMDMALSSDCIVRMSSIIISRRSILWLMEGLGPLSSDLFDKVNDLDIDDLMVQIGNLLLELCKNQLNRETEEQKECVASVKVSAGIAK